MNGARLRLHGGGFFEIDPTFFRLIVLEVEFAQLQSDLEEVVGPIVDFEQVGSGFATLVQQQVDEAGIVMGQGLFGIEGHRLLELRQGAHEFAGHAVANAQAVVQVCICGVELQGGLVFVAALLIFALVVEPVAGDVETDGMEGNQGLGREEFCVLEGLASIVEDFVLGIVEGRKKGQTDRDGGAGNRATRASRPRSLSTGPEAR